MAPPLRCGLGWGNRRQIGHRLQWTAAQRFCESLCSGTVTAVSVRLADLLADDGLNLVVRAGSRADLQREVRWCAVTELDDPRHWLQGGELVLTTGLRQRTAAAQRQFVRRVAECGVAAIGFG